MKHKDNTIRGGVCVSVREAGGVRVKFQRRLLSSSAVLVLAFGFAGGAYAQSTGTAKDQISSSGPAPAANQQQSTQVEEIVVTAQKQKENIQSVPKTVEVFNQKALSDAGVSNIEDLTLVSPSIQGASSTLFQAPAIRGISSFALSIGVQTQTGIVLDDIPQPSFSTLANELIDVARVEILPGPQSTLSGRNAAGGLINIVTDVPTQTFHLRFSAEQTDDSQTRIAGVISGPISDTLEGSVSGYWDKWAGPLFNAGQGGKRIDGFDQRGVRGKLKWNPTSEFTATLTGYYTKADFVTPPLLYGNPYVSVPSGSGALYVGETLQALLPQEPFGPYNRTVDYSATGTAQNENKGGSLRLDYVTGFGTVSSISSYSKSQQPRSDLVLPLSFGGNYIYASTNTDVSYKTQEIRISSPDNSKKLQYLLGAIYTDTNNFEPYYRPVIAPVNLNRNTDTKSFAAYGRATYEIIDDTSLTAGLRFQHDHQSYSFIFADGSAPNSSNAYGYNFVTGEVSLAHNFTKDIKGYITYANAQTGKAYDLEDNADAATPAGLQPIPSEKVQNYEIGLKTQWMDHRLTINLSAFDTKYQNYQVQTLQLGSAQVLPVIRLYAIGKVEDKGVELEANYAVNRDLRLGLAATYLDARINSYPDAQCYVGQVQGCVPLIPGNATSPMVQTNLSGPLPGTSKFRSTASARYTIRMPNLPFDGDIQVFYRHQGKTYFDLFGNPSAVQGAVDVVNLSVGLHDHEDHYNLELFVNNLTNNRYYSNISPDGTTYPYALSASYARDSFRYMGAKFSVNF